MRAYDLARPLLFRVDPERTHQAVMALADATLGSPLGRLAEPLYRHADARLRTTVFGIDFPNPVGLAAGFDKNAEHVRALARLGFGHVEIGTVTGEAQPGNDRPRLFRLPTDRGLLNRMGFNNDGSAAVERRLTGLHPPVPLGVNIGKTKIVSNDEAVADYEKSFRRLWRFADYFVVNVSSPNTPGLRDLQSRGPLTQILARLQQVNAELAGAHDPGQRKPLLVKIAPDLADSALDEVLDVARECGLHGIVATNTTISRQGLRTRGVDDLGTGGVSGAPLRTRARDVVSYLHARAPDLPIIGVGGIFGADDALAMLSAGASLVQVWTGFVYHGPTIVRDICRGLAEVCAREGWENIARCRAAP